MKPYKDSRVSTQISGCSVACAVIACLHFCFAGVAARASLIFCLVSGAPVLSFASVEVFQDSFEGESLNSVWSASTGGAASVTVSGGSLHLLNSAKSSTATVKTEVSNKFNFFRAEQIFELDLASYSSTPSASSSAYFMFMIGSTATASFSSNPDLFGIRIYGDGCFYVAAKENSTSSLSNFQLNSGTAGSAITGVSLTLNATNYYVTFTTASSGLLTYSGAHGLSLSSWGSEGNSSIIMQQITGSSATSAEFAVDEITVSSRMLGNEGFEESFAHWDLTNDGGMSQVLADAASVGALGLRVTDTSTSSGSSVRSDRFPATPDYLYSISFDSRVISGSGIAMYVYFYGESGLLTSKSLGLGTSADWIRRTLDAAAPAGAMEAEIWIHSYNASQVVADLDDFSISAVELLAESPWTPTYKIKPSETNRLTDADVVGPDGLVYPDWRMTGLQGWTNPAVIVPAATFATKTNQDISGDIQDAIEAATSQGGIIEIPTGTFYLDRSIVVKRDHIVIRGAGREQTTLVFRDQIPMGTLRWFNWAGTGSSVAADSVVEVQANPCGLVHMRVSCNSNLVSSMTQQDNNSWGNRFVLRMNGEQLLGKLGAGTHTLDATVDYSNGQSFTQNFTITLSTNDSGCPMPDHHAAFVFAGRGLQGDPILLAADGARGSRTLSLTSGHGLQTGDRIWLEAPATERWNELVGNQAPWGTYRANQYEVLSVDGSEIIINQPLRIEFPLVDGPFVQKIGVLSGCGLEELTVAQEIVTTNFTTINPITSWYPIEDLWTDGVAFNYVWNSRISNVRIVNAGRDPIYLIRSKFCEVLQSECDGSIFKGNGGTGYAGLERSYDCLIDSLITQGLRHAPNVQWSSSGNVIRNGIFSGSDAQWHAGWTSENLFEGNVMASTLEDMSNGSYGWGLFASGPDSVLHGPQGPRNVVYRNDISAPKGGLCMLGSNEGWIIAHNRFLIEQGYAVWGKEKSFDHIIQDNVFIVNEPNDPAILFDFPDCTGVELINNTIYGPVSTVAGFRYNVGSFAVNTGNLIEPSPPPGSLPALPTPAVESIFLWQKASAD